MGGQGDNVLEAEDRIAADLGSPQRVDSPVGNQYSFRVQGPVRQGDSQAEGQDSRTALFLHGRLAFQVAQQLFEHRLHEHPESVLDAMNQSNENEIVEVAGMADEREDAVEGNRSRRDIHKATERHSLAEVPCRMLTEALSDSFLHLHRSQHRLQLILLVRQTSLDPRRRLL